MVLPEGDWILGFKVLKFGGSILRDRGDFERVSEVLAGELKGGTVPIAVVSPMNGVTDRLVDAVEAIRDDGGLEFRNITLPVLKCAARRPSRIDHARPHRA